MKTRFDFVTNSSSSSFILGFQSREDALTRVSEEMAASIRAYALLLKNISEAEPVDKQEVVNRLMDRVDWETKHEILDSGEVDYWLFTHNYEVSRRDFEETERYKQLFECTKDWKETQYEHILKKPFVIELEYGNDADAANEDYKASVDLESFLEKQGYTMAVLNYH